MDEGNDRPLIGDKEAIDRLTEHQRETGIRRAVDDVKAAIKHYNDADRKHILNEALRQVGSELEVH